MLANEMSAIARVSRNSNDILNELWEKTKEYILEKSKQGNNKCCYHNWGYPEYSQQLQQKIIDNGFRLRYGYQINNDYHNQNTLYIIW